MIRDGYGDIEMVLEDWDVTLSGVARRILPVTDPRFADVLQEGRIAFWREWQAEPKFALHRARLRMRHLADTRRRERYTGHEPLTGHIEAKTVAVLDAPVGEGDTGMVDLLTEASDSLSGVEIAYHRGEILRALDALPDLYREYVVLRFWGGWTDVEIAVMREVDRNVPGRQWRRIVAPRLARELAHLGVS